MSDFNKIFLFDISVSSVNVDANSQTKILNYIREAAKKNFFFFEAWPLRWGGGGVNGCATKE